MGLKSRKPSKQRYQTYNVFVEELKCRLGEISISLDSGAAIMVSLDVSD